MRKPYDVPHETTTQVQGVTKLAYQDGRTRFRVRTYFDGLRVTIGTYLDFKTAANVANGLEMDTENTIAALSIDAQSRILAVLRKKRAYYKTKTDRIDALITMASKALWTNEANAEAESDGALW